ncbi:MAG: rRNA maturation RNase YbeY [Bacteroidota bacterium]
MVRVKVFNTHPRKKVSPARCTQYVTRVLGGEKIRNAEVSVVLVGSRRIRTLNRQYLKHDYVTDVISFTLESGENLEGEIYVNLDRATHQAKTFGVTPAHEAARLVVHGALHLTGYDDATARQKEKMAKREDVYLRYWFRHSEERGL